MKQRLMLLGLMLTLTVLAAGCQSVHVRDIHGNAISWAKISVIVQGEGDTGITAWTDMMGNAMLPQSTEAGKTEYLEVSKEGYLTRRIRRPAGREKADVELSQSRTGTAE